MILKLCILAVCAVILVSLVRIYKPELAACAVVCASLILLFSMVSSMEYSLDYLEEIYNNLSYSKTYFPIVLKALGIAYLTEFTSAICQDAGEKTIAGKVELAGKIAIFFIALPIFTSLVELLDSLI